MATYCSFTIAMLFHRYKKHEKKKRIYSGASSIGLLYLYFENQISILMEDFVTYPLFFFPTFFTLWRNFEEADRLF